jgi:hypothetical protein
MDEHYATLTDMMVLLMEDVVRSGEHLEKQDTEDQRAFWARVHTRAVFAAIEGACECFRRQAFIAEANKIPQEVSLGKLSVLAGETYFVTDEGEIRAQNLRMRFLAHVLLSLNSYAEAQGAKHRTNKEDQRHRVRKAVDVRNRITHPKNLKSLEITKAEIKDIDFTLKWFLNEVVAIAREKGCDLPPFAF